MSKKSVNRRDVILRHLRRKPINRLDAFRLYGVLRLASAIYELREMGHNIVAEKATVRDVRGRLHTVNVYRLLPGVAPQRPAKPVQIPGTLEVFFPDPRPFCELKAAFSRWCAHLWRSLLGALGIDRG
ncbi:MAG: helix-turn-helix domain-containing protein [Burkholderiales bacterium]|jgi:hypothetical protein|nr:helix-turn-helix domain-containing protein [Burkholderiales bacterium]